MISVITKSDQMTAFTLCVEGVCLNLEREACDREFFGKGSIVATEVEYKMDRHVTVYTLKVSPIVNTPLVMSHCSTTC